MIKIIKIKTFITTKLFSIFPSFDIPRAYNYIDRLDRPLNKVIESHFHLCIIDQIKIIQKFNTLDGDRLKLLQYLCISIETSDAVVQCYKQVFKRYRWTCADLLCVISVKLNKQQLDGLVDKGINIHERCKINCKNSIGIYKKIYAI
ncbi:hypothetical protein RFI_05399 [Reticulomyxa filosa]|uniref:Uncharacterized protein n=1 Tax=Reticulomyxa filosa TaxID=46433 RepID=X6NZH8_RETFI|nr:hypothetical protein RFI_05399 [Reticulomyxa filosa]|eukprot:ETO31720.1 hypothetical protein RFI_05399 [Reticulomyxa filosa]